MNPSHNIRDEALDILVAAANACPDPDCDDCQTLQRAIAPLLARATPPADDADDEEDEDSEDEEDDDEEDEDEDSEDENVDDAPPQVPAPAPKKIATSQTTPKAKAKRAADPTITRSTSVVALQSATPDAIQFPISRVDTEKREVEGVLSSEEIDTFGTIFDYTSMKRAVQERWHGNVREQHDVKKAVGRGVLALFDDDKKLVTVRTRISKGAEDTWQKILDGTLTGYSIGASNAKTESRTVNGKAIPTYVDFDLAEVSLVDAPSNPAAARSGLTIYRATVTDGTVTEFYNGAVDQTPEVVTAIATLKPAPWAVEPAEPATMRDQIAALRAEVTRNDPASPDDASSDMATVERAMQSDTGYTHRHSHTYNDGMVHQDNNHHAHADGTTHAHPHMHRHVGDGDGASEHVHLHEHDTEFRVVASDTNHHSFIPQGDAQLQQLQPADTKTVVESTIVERAAAPTVTRYGQRLSGDTMSGLHSSRDTLLRTCGCPDCCAMLELLNDDDDGDEDGMDIDNDGDGMGSRVQRAQLQRAVRTSITEQLTPIATQLRAITARLAQVQTPDLTRFDERMQVIESTIARIAQHDDALQPVLRAADRMMSINGGLPDASQAESVQSTETLRSMALNGQFTADQQTAIAAALIRQQR